jgi:peptidoglycan/xylan/chitin deacetylase (PgdA/CDA1 family)
MLRRQLARYKRQKYAAVWPILPTAGNKPADWPGWPDGKKFAFVLTHDVEWADGQDKVLAMMKLEKSFGFRSSFNFVPERYAVSAAIRQELVANGFEVGVHGLNHDGKLFSSQAVFKERVGKINEYARAWKAVGFRAPAMHHNLDWMLDLQVDYDSSTFDTDPFEPQADGVDTIFPFVVAGQGDKPGFVELPYSLPQDHALFVILQEKDISIWQQKVDWIYEQGGMALLNVHPDYVCFEGKQGREEFPVALYAAFLEYVQTKYEGQYWHALPREVASFVKGYQE